jgi:hypothetical protein
MEDEQYFESSNKFWMRFEFFLIELVKHVQKVFDVSQFFGGEIKVSSDTVSVRVGGNCGDVTKDFVDLFVSDFFVFVDSFAYKTWILLWM